MSSIQQAFWHRGQRAVIGTMPMSRFTLAVDSSSQMTAAATTYMINGAWGTTTAIAAASTSTPTKANFAAGLHANNPAKTKETETGEVPILQIFLDLSVAALSQVRAVVTISGTGAADNNATNSLVTRGKLHFYAGEIVLNTLTAVRPDLDLSDECPLAEILLVNTSSSAVATGTAGTYTYWNVAGTGITDIAFVNAV